MFFPQHYCMPKFMQAQKMMSDTAGAAVAPSPDNLIEEVFSKILQRFPHAQHTTANPDLILILAITNEEYTHLSAKYPQAKKLFIYRENIFRNIKRIAILQYALYRLSDAAGVGKNIVPYLYSRTDKIWDLLSHHDKRQYRYAGKTAYRYIKNIRKYEFAIITNAYRHKNVFCLPHALQSYLNINSIINVKKENKYRQKKRFCAFIANHFTPERRLLVKKLSAYKKVDCYSTAGYNYPVHEADRTIVDGLDENYKIYKDYKFVVCFENSSARNYITEKIINAMRANTIPLYWGASNVHEYFNPDSFINSDDYVSWNDIVQDVITLDQNESRYQAILDVPYFHNQQLPDITTHPENGISAFLNHVLDA